VLDTYDLAARKMSTVICLLNCDLGLKEPAA
jgi:hypothetical protein